MLALVRVGDALIVVSLFWPIPLNSNTLSLCLVEYAITKFLGSVTMGLFNRIRTALSALL